MPSIPTDGSFDDYLLFRSRHGRLTVIKNAKLEINQLDDAIKAEKQNPQPEAKTKPAEERQAPDTAVSNADGKDKRAALYFKDRYRGHLRF
jgi:hypothetical protein